jgi:hypothetical protein
VIVEGPGHLGHDRLGGGLDPGLLGVELHRLGQLDQALGRRQHVPANEVSAARRVDRSNSRSPKCSSSAAMRRLATDCGTRAAAAPRVKLPRSPT